MGQIRRPFLVPAANCGKNWVNENRGIKLLGGMGQSRKRKAGLNSQGVILKLNKMKKYLWLNNKTSARYIKIIHGNLK